MAHKTLTIAALCAAWTAPLLLGAQSMYDARILAYRGLRYACVDSVTPVLRIQNAGSASMTSCVVETWKNGVVDNSFDWLLAVAAITNEVRQPAFPPVAATTGDVLEFRIISVNGFPDEDSTGNVLSLTVGGAVPTCGQQQVDVEVLTDAQPGETEWAIRDDLGQVVAQGGPYADPATLETQTVPLPAEACLSLELTDAGGDGMAGGHLYVYCDGVELIAIEGTDFTDAAYEGLRASSGLGIRTVDPAPGLVLFPDPAHDRVTVNVTGLRATAALRIVDAAGRTVLERSLRATNGPVTLDLHGLAPGPYTVLVSDQGTTLHQRLVVE
ncbi:MAG: T9SS type A sorting domain-containing protein [Flavobacteriales bacterium]|nr:T9SS type A sorting domain-containing protein [Flavobacteriales bacterium]